jgi:hypothetical protein
MCAFFLLLAFTFLLRYIDTGQRRYYVYQWIVFILGFGALELNVVYPALAAGFTLLAARKYFRGTLPLFLVSAAYALIHSVAAPVPKSGDYAMHFGGSMLRTLAILWTWTVGPTYLSTPMDLPSWVLPTGIAIVSLVLLVFLASRWRSGVAPFFLLWYLVTIGPMLPLRDHVTEYYVYVPAIGLCWLGGWGLAESWRSAIPVRIGAVAVALIYVFLQAPHLVAATEWNYNLTRRTRNLVEGVAGAHELHPKQTILLYGVDEDLFLNVIRDHAFRLLDMNRVYLAPGTQKSPGEEEFILPGFVITRALSQNELVVYDVRGPQLHNVTTMYAALPRPSDIPQRVDVGDPLTGDLLGPEWYKLEVDHRWMPKRATLRLGGPASPGRQLFLRGNCTEEQLRAGDLQVVVTVEGSTLPSANVHTSAFELDFPLPPSVVGKPEIHIAIEVSRTFRPPTDSRELGLAFGVVEIR